MNATLVWDDIVVGAGSAGAVLAARLSEQPGRRVMLIEAGPDFPSPAQMPEALKHAGAPVLSGYNWDHSARLRDGSSQQFPYALGKVIGGSSAVNGAIALRALREDFDDWEAQGLAEWQWSRVLPYYRKLEFDNDHSDALHGTDGPVPIVRPDMRQLHALQAAFLEGCKGIGLPLLEDLNRSSKSGVGLVPSNCVGHLRISSATAYLAAARRRAGFAIEAEAVVTRILFDGRRAAGVELQARGMLRLIRARRVTICAGTINTVALLLRSGIGSERACRDLGVAPVADLPGVGENLVDHPAVMLWMAPRDDSTARARLAHQVMARLSSAPQQVADLNLFAINDFDTANVPILKDLLKSTHANAISVVLTQPASRGRVSLPNGAANAAPVIELRLGSAEQDIVRLAAGVRAAWRIAKSAAMQAQLKSVFLWTDKVVDNDAVLQAAIGRFISATWHPVGTARMGPSTDRYAVVDPHCRVHGVHGLRIVDASVMPQIPRAPTNLTCMMLAERVADWMRQESGDAQANALPTLTLEE